VYKAIKGMKDILPDEVSKWQFIEDEARKIFKNFNYKEIRTPILEFTSLFKRGVGENTDIVEKEMYTFDDKNGKSLSLRPEGTASVVRAFIQAKAYNLSPINKYYYIGEMYRHERPQKGRYRAFHQMGVEMFGAASAASDFEIIKLIQSLLSAFKIDDYKFYINSIGCKECRPNYKNELIKFLTPLKEELCHNCQKRVDTNPLRVLDCKSKSCQVVVKDAPIITDFLCDSCSTHHNDLVNLLEDSNVNYIIDPRIVRGLDYYVKTTFEVKVMNSDLGAQNTILGGGRYNGLVKELGGPDIEAIGFGIGLERVILSLDENINNDNFLDYSVISLGKNSLKTSLKVVNKLRELGFKVDMDYRAGSMKSQMRWANKQNSKKVIIIGENELEKKIYIEKDMQNSTQKEKNLSDLL